MDMKDHECLRSDDAFGILEVRAPDRGLLAIGKNRPSSTPPTPAPRFSRRPSFSRCLAERLEALQEHLLQGDLALHLGLPAWLEELRAVRS